MLSTLCMTFRYTFAVRGFYEAPAKAFPTRMGCVQSDMFRLDLTKDEASGGASLQDFHGAFLQSPVFQLELWLLTWVGTVTKETTTDDHLLQVASGDKSSFGPWTSWATDGRREKPISASSDPSSACTIMRCYAADKPFCDTWWAMEKTAESPHPELVFGTALKLPKEASTTTLLTMKLMDPLHRLYSRVLLASAKAKLMEARHGKAD